VRSAFSRSRRGGSTAGCGGIHPLSQVTREGRDFTRWWSGRKRSCRVYSLSSYPGWRDRRVRVRT